MYIIKVHYSMKKEILIKLYVAHVVVHPYMINVQFDFMIYLDDHA